MHRLAMLEWLISNVLLNANSNYIVRDLINKDNVAEATGNWQQKEAAAAASTAASAHSTLTPSSMPSSKSKGTLMAVANATSA